MFLKTNYMKELIKKNSTLGICLFLIVGTICVYMQTINYDFVGFDDPLYIYENTQIQQGLTFDNIIWAFTTTHAGNWHPLTWISHMVDCQIFGVEPGWHHISNIVFHIANTILLFIVFRRMTDGVWQSAFIAALFAFHPLHVESVAWISERKDVLSTFFWIVTMWYYIGYVHRPSLKRYLLVAVSFSLGLMSKPMLVTLPFVLLLLDFWPLNRFNSQRTNDYKAPISTKTIPRLVFEKTPLFFLAAISSALTIYAQKIGGAVTSLHVIPLEVRIYNALLSYLKYIEKTFFPFKLAVLYPYPTTIHLWKVILSSFILLMISFIALKTIKRHPFFLIGWLWYIGTLMPVIGLVQVGRQSIADRYTYIPLIGIFIIIAWGIPAVLGRYRHNFFWITLFAIVLIFHLITLTFKQIGYWKNPLTLYEQAIKVTDDNFLVHTYLGDALYDMGRQKKAIDHYLKAVSMRPEFLDANLKLAIALTSLGHAEEAVNYYSHVLKLKPDWVEVRLNLGKTYEMLGRMREAISQYSQALEIQPDYDKAHFYLGVALGKHGNLELAVKHLTTTLHLNPAYAEAHYNLGVAFLLQGTLTKAIYHFRQELRINPEFLPAQKNLKVALMKQQKNSQFEKEIDDAHIND